MAVAHHGLMGSVGGCVRLLEAHVVNQIAAGEVVERPAAAVKELLENALDAGAERVTIDLVDSGRTLIRVADDGAGMSSTDAVAALERHATSKISIAEDLLAVRTLGFRGEALPSIASVSRLTLATAQADGGRTVLRAEGGSVQAEPGGSGPRGTTVTVEELFYNTPARLKFLKSDTSELGACLDVVGRLAVAYAGVALRLTHNGQLAFETNGDGDSLDAIAGVWSRDLARSLAEVDVEVAGIRVTGFVSPPHVTKPTRAYQFLCVNGRPVRTRTLTAAIDQAYRDLTPERRHAVLALNLEIDPARIDVNVSPTKSEVKFQHEGAAFEAIRAAVRGALMEHGMMPSLGAVAAANSAIDASGAPTPFTCPAASDVYGMFGLSRPSLGAEALASPFGMPSSASVDPFTSETTAPLAASSERFPFGDLVDGLRVIGQAMLTFIVAETRRGLIIMDQHVAHERILYEYLCGIRGNAAIEAQPLLVPASFTLDRRAAVLLRERLDEITRLGFQLEPFGGESYVLRSAPAALRGKDPVRVLHDLIDELVDGVVGRRLMPTREQIWITTACKLAVKAGDVLSHPEMERLIVDLASTENPYLCPHGRPITVTLDGGALLRLFKRT
ncbi:MAG: DNA mismatch repair endonuclease MutL [Fimbriimonadaceae bacterium]